MGESLRQHFLQSGMTETVRALQASSAAFVTAQQQLSSVLHTVADPRYGIMAQVEEANRRLTLSLEVRAKAIDELLHNLKTAFLHVWAPLLCGASLILGLILGMGLQGWKDSQATASPIAPQSESQLMLDEERQEPDVPHNKLKKPIQKRPRATFPVDQNH